MNYKDLKLSEEELDDLYQQLKYRKDKEIFEENEKRIEENKKYIGKCYKESNGKKYIKVIGARSSNTYRMECMCFDFPVKIHSKLQLTKIFNPCNSFGKIEFDGIYVEDYPLFCNSWKSTKPTKVINTLEEITEEEYFKKMHEYVNELQEKLKEDIEK